MFFFFFVYRRAGFLDCSAFKDFKTHHSTACTTPKVLSGAVPYILHQYKANLVSSTTKKLN